MTKAEATRQAKEEITMYRQGKGWIVSAYDPRIQLNRISSEMQFWNAQDKVRAERTSRIEELLCIAYDAEHGDDCHKSGKVEGR